jgi:hypothetical protein
MAMPQNFALLKTKIISPILFTLFRNKALALYQQKILFTSNYKSLSV